MRTMVITYEWPPIGGGMGRRARYITEAIPGDVDLITSGPVTVPDAEYFEIRSMCQVGVRKKSMHHWTAREMLSWAIKARVWARRIYQDRRPDKILVFGGLPGVFVTPDLSRTTIMLSGSDVPGFSRRTWWLRHCWLYIFLIRQCDLVGNSMHLTQMANKAFAVPVRTISSCINVSDWEFRTSRNGKAVYIARDVPRKRIPLAKQVAKEAGVDLDVYSNVPHSEIRDKLPSYSYYLNTSKNEGMSMAILEAMACGMPVVTTECGGHETIKGFVASGDDQLVELLQQATRCVWDRKAIRDYISECFNPEIMIKRCYSQGDS